MIRFKRSAGSETKRLPVERPAAPDGSSGAYRWRGRVVGRVGGSSLLAEEL